MARWRYSFRYDGPRNEAVLFGRVFKRGETVTIALDHWNSGIQRQAERAGLEYLGLVDCLAQEPVEDPGTGTEATVSVPEPDDKPLVIRRRGRGRGSY